MKSINQLIGKRFEEILKELYPELNYVGDERNLVPDFEHEHFYAEAKVAFSQHDFAIHLKRYQIDAFQKYTAEKPVLYLIGFHDFENSTEKLHGLSTLRKRNKLNKEMLVNKFYVVDNKTITKIWEKRNYVCEKGHIEDCVVREGHIKQIIENKAIRIKNELHLARNYYGVCSEEYSFSLPVLIKTKDIEVGHILPLNQNTQLILDYFKK
jgi:hypothetical protein